MKFWFNHRDPVAPSEQDGRNESYGIESSKLHTVVFSADQGIGEQLISLLSERGHHVQLREDIETQPWSAGQRAPDLILIDWRLPDEQVEAFLEAMDASGARRPAVVALLESRYLEHHQRILDLGVHDIVTLPLDKHQLNLRLSISERRILSGLLPAEADEPIHAKHPPAVHTHHGQLHSALWEWDVDSGQMQFSPDFFQLTDHDPTTHPPKADQWLKDVHDDDREQLRDLLDGLVVGERNTMEHCFRIVTADGDERHMLLQAYALQSEDRKTHRIIGRQTDVTDDTGGLLDGFAHLLLDPLTRLASRAVLMDRLRQAFARAARPSGRPFAVMFFDLDRFKNVNDGLGHRIGDRLLCAIADRVKTICRPSDTVCRFGGDEFVLVTEDVDNVRQATAIADRLHSQFAVPFDIDGSEVYASISTGIALWHAGYHHHEDLLRDADNAMARAKSMGRNRYSVFDEKMHAEVVATLELENDLRRAVARGEFITYYQPIVLLESGRLVGFEALVRWRHPERGLLLPGAFIAVAEEMGVAVQLDRIVAEEACRQLRAWDVKFRPDPPLTMSLNISTTQFLQPDLVTYIDRTLRQNGLYGTSIKLEVTESVLMEHTAHASAMLDQLRAIDIAISIDDFGTGYSSLAYLRRFEIDSLKIDYSFVSRMLEDENSSEIVRTIANLAKNLGKETVAEGVETRSQLELLREMGVDRVQGFFVAPPIPAGEIEKLLELIRYEDNHLEAILFDRLHPELNERGD